MPNIHIKTDERRAYEANVLHDFKKGENITNADREAAEIIAARSREAYDELKKMEEYISLS